MYVTGEMVTIPVDSWSDAEELAGRADRERGIVETSSWTLSLLTGIDNVDSSADVLVREINGLDYVLDLIVEMELAPAFPACRSNFLQSGGNSRGSRRHNNKVCVGVSVAYFTEHAI
jgi:myosin-15